MYSRFIIERPVLAAVISIVIIIAGLVTMSALPIDPYPDITPPTVTVTTTYPGADAVTLNDTVAQVIEEQVNGVEGMIYMSSTCANDGTYTLTVTFEVGMDLDMATVLTQNQVTIATPQLPDEVQRQGVSTQKKSTNFVLAVNLYSPNNTYNDLELSNYASINMVDTLARVPGVGNVTIFGSKDYGMRIWLNPDAMHARQLTVTDVTDAVRSQNVQVAAGNLGQPPCPKGTEFQYTVTVTGRLSTPEEFKNIVVKVGPDGHPVKIKDIGTVELGSQLYNSYSTYNGKPSATIAIYQLPGSNAIDVEKGCKAELERLASRFPKDLKYNVTYDSTWFIHASINEITVTLFQAVGLVVLITFVFLQDWRTSLIPALTIPVSLIGTFIVMALLGFSINTLTMFGLVLAIGIVVDDSIVVVENTQRKIDELGLAPREAAIAAMNEVIGPCIATTLVLLSVFVPTAFMGGISGRLYQQFSLTIAASTAFSTVNALTLSPALCGVLLRPTSKTKFFFFDWFNKIFAATERFYGGIVKMLVRKLVIVAILFLGITVLTWLGFVTLPTGFIPTEDQGYFMAVIQLPDAASLERTSAVTTRATDMVMKTPGVANVISIGGMSMIDSTISSNTASLIVMLDDWDKRKTPELQINAIVEKLADEFKTIEEARIMSFVPPTIPGLGTTGGLQMQLQNYGNMPLPDLQAASVRLMQMAAGNPEVKDVFTTFRANVPQIHLDIDRDKVMTQGIALGDVFDTLQVYLGSLYVNDFNLYGKTFQVKMQALSQYRVNPEDVGLLDVRDKNGNMVPLNALLVAKPSFGPQTITRYNMYESATFLGDSGEGYSSGQAMDAMTDMVHELPGFGLEWTGMSFQEQAAKGQAPFIFALGAVFVYLFLAAQYESFLLPISVILSVPFALLGAVAANWMREYDNNIYTQIGFVLLIGLCSKSSILIVEFAKAKHEEQGQDRFTAAIEAARLRFRAILMTAFSDIFGWFPLVVATGAGMLSRRALGTAVWGGMIAATVIGLFFVPALYVIVQTYADWLAKRRQMKTPPAADNESAG